MRSIRWPVGRARNRTNYWQIEGEHDSRYMDMPAWPWTCAGTCFAAGIAIFALIERLLQ